MIGQGQAWLCPILFAQHTVDKPGLLKKADVVLARGKKNRNAKALLVTAGLERTSWMSAIRQVVRYSRSPERHDRLV